MKSIAFIPARYAATRFPAKLMQKLGSKTVIRHTYENSVATHLFDEVIVVTDNKIIFNEITENGGYALMSKSEHQSGSDRIAEAAASLDVDLIVNVQGDEPFVEKQALQQLMSVFSIDAAKQIQVASLMYAITDKKTIEDTNSVKVVVDKNMNALLFSRSVIPFQRDEKGTVTYYKHIGIYAYRKEALMNFIQWPPSQLEVTEKLEQLRYLENGIKIKMVITTENPVSIDTPADLEKAKKFLANLAKNAVKTDMQ